MPGSESQNESSLYFLSTQIQSRHEDQERVDSNVRKLNRFKNSMEPSKRTPVQEAKIKKPRRKKASSNSRKITSISAFVRETLGNKKISNTQGILDYFTGDSQKVNEFISKIESATATPHLLSRKSAADKSNVLFSEAEWKAFVEKLQLRFPNLSRKNKKTLKVVTKQLDALRKSEQKTMEDNERTNEEGKKIWTQASRQPSSELTTEDIRWLYDLEEDQLVNETTVDEQEPSYQGPSCFTLSQVLGESQVDNLLTDDSLIGGHEDNSYLSGIVEDSEPDMGEFSKSQMEDFMTKRELPVSSPFSKEHVRESHFNLTPLTPQGNSEPEATYMPEKEATITSSRQKVSENSSSVDVLSSIAFAPTCDSANPKHVSKNSGPDGSSADSQIEDVFKTPTKWPDHLQISSSPLSSKRRSKIGPRSSINGSPLQDMQRDEKEQEYLQLSPTKESKQNAFEHMSDVVEFHGHVELTENSRFILKPLPKELYSDQARDHVSDSEDDTHEVSFIGIMKPVDLSSELMNSAKKARSFLQVPSSP